MWSSLCATETIHANVIIRQTIIKGALDNFNIIPNFFPKKVGIFIPLEVLAWVKTACQVLCSRLTYILSKKYEYFYHFLFFKVDFNKYTIQ